MRTILLPTDFSETAANAADYAFELANFFEAKLILLNVFPLPMTVYDSPVPFPAEMLAELKHKSEDNLLDLKKKLLAKPHRKFDLEYHAEAGDVYDVIKSAAKQFNADLIVMGIVGHAGKVKEYIIGSTTVKTARKSDVPVLIIPEKIKYKRIRKIAYACDMEKTEESSLVFVLKYFANLFDAEIEIVHVEHPYEEISSEKARNSIFIEKKLETIRHKTTYISNANVAQALEDYFMVHPFDMVVLNPKKHSIFHNLFNESVTKELAFHLRLPILATNH